MARRKREIQVQNTPEFQAWLRSKKVSRRERKDPEALRAHYQEYHNLNRQTRKRSPLLNFKMPSLGSIDLDQLGNGIRTAQDIFGALQNLRGMWDITKK